MDGEQEAGAEDGGALARREAGSRAGDGAQVDQESAIAARATRPKAMASGWTGRA